MTQGFKAFLGPHSVYWSETGLSWKVQVGYFSSLGVFLLLLGLSLGVIGPAAFEITEPELIDDVAEGESEVATTGSTGRTMRIINSFLDSL